jgi:serine/threonine protein kinase
MHGDLKPQNIGFIGDSRAMLLDVGTAIPFTPGGLIAPDPGRGGTVSYLAPEREMTTDPQPNGSHRVTGVDRLVGYDKSIDIWSMGILLYQLTYGTHPLDFRTNPWRHTYQHLQVNFHDRYTAMLDILSPDTDQGKFHTIWIPRVYCETC